MEMVVLGGSLTNVALTIVSVDPDVRRSSVESMVWLPGYESATFHPGQFIVLDARVYVVMGLIPVVDVHDNLVAGEETEEDEQYKRHGHVPTVIVTLIPEESIDTIPGQDELAGVLYSIATRLANGAIMSDFEEVAKEAMSNGEEG